MFITHFLLQIEQITSVQVCVIQLSSTLYKSCHFRGYDAFNHAFTTQPIVKTEYRHLGHPDPRCFRIIAISQCSRSKLCVYKKVTFEIKIRHLLILLKSNHIKWSGEWQNKLTHLNVSRKASILIQGTHGDQLYLIICRKFRMFFLRAELNDASILWQSLKKCCIKKQRSNKHISW